MTGRCGGSYALRQHHLLWLQQLPLTERLRLSVNMSLEIYQNKTGVADTDPNPDPYVFGPLGSGSDSGSGTFYHHAKILRKTLIPTVF
jgi:hypothetical protein